MSATIEQEVRCPDCDKMFTKITILDPGPNTRVIVSTKCPRCKEASDVVKRPPKAA